MHFLSKSEIKKDIKEIERSFLPEDTDSDSSVNSDDILPSTYPVKPRRTPRVTARNNYKEQQLIDVSRDRTTLTAADEALTYIRAIKASKKELHQAELERERYETTYLVNLIFPF